MYPNSIFKHAYPYSDLHELNLDWILKQVLEQNEHIKEFVNENSIKLADPIEWSRTSHYDKATIVEGPEGNSYLSLKEVPAGIELSNSEYWIIVSNFNAQLESLKVYVTPEMFGAKGDGTSDDTEAMRKTIATGKPVYLKNKYLISGVLYPTNDIFGNVGAEIIVSDKNNTRAIKVNTANVTLSNFTVTGNLDTYPEELSPYNHGIDIEADNVKIEHVKVRNCGGDGIYLGGDRQINNTVVTNCEISRTRRNGISIISGYGFFIENVKITEIGGADPCCGVDIEPNHETEKVYGIINNVIAEECTKRAFSCNLIHVDENSIYNVVFNNCIAINTSSDQSDEAYNGDFYVAEYGDCSNCVITFNNCISDNPGTRGFRVRSLCTKPSNITAKIKSVNCSLPSFGQLICNDDGTDRIYYNLEIDCEDSYNGYSLLLQRHNTTTVRSYKIDLKSNKFYSVSLNTTPIVYFNGMLGMVLNAQVQSDGTVLFSDNDKVTITRYATGKYRFNTDLAYNYKSFMVIIPNNTSGLNYTVTARSAREVEIGIINSSGSFTNSDFLVMARYSTVSL